MSFEQFWSLYPRRLNKAQALKSYNSAIKKGATHAEITAGASEYAAYCQRNNTANQHICHASTWINQERWLNDYRADDSGQQAKGTGAGGRQSQISMAMDAAVKVVQKSNMGEHQQRDDPLDWLFLTR